jgi:hypothetical protein
VTTWSGDGAKLKSCEFSGEPALRAVLTDDGTRVVASDFSGHVGVWTAVDGKKISELDANPPLLADQLIEARKKVATLEKRAKSPAPESTETETTAKSKDEVAIARAALVKAQAEFTEKAQEVARLKELQKSANPPGDIEQRLGAARAGREQARTGTNTATLALHNQEKRTAGIQKSTPVAKSDPAAELALAREHLARLTRAESQQSRVDKTASIGGTRTGSKGN